MKLSTFAMTASLISAAAASGMPRITGVLIVAVQLPSGALRETNRLPMTGLDPGFDPVLAGAGVVAAGVVVAGEADPGLGERKIVNGVAELRKHPARTRDARTAPPTRTPHQALLPQTVAIRSSTPAAITRHRDQSSPSSQSCQKSTLEGETPTERLLRGLRVCD